MLAVQAAEASRRTGRSVRLGAGAVLCAALLLAVAAPVGAAGKKTGAAAPKPTPLPPLSLPAMPALPASAGLPAMPSVGLASPGDLGQVAGWSSFFSGEAKGVSAAAKAALGVPATEAGFAKLWAGAQSAATSAEDPMTEATLPSASRLAKEAPGLSSSEIAALPAMAPPTLALPAPPALPESVQAGYQAVFGAPPSLDASLPSYTSLEVNPAYASASGGLAAAYANSIGCAPNQTSGCSFMATPSELENAAGTLTNGESLGSEQSALFAGDPSLYGRISDVQDSVNPSGYPSVPTATLPAENGIGQDEENMLGGLPGDIAGWLGDWHEDSW